MRLTQKALRRAACGLLSLLLAAGPVAGCRPKDEPDGSSSRPVHSRFQAAPPDPSGAPADPTSDPSSSPGDTSGRTAVSAADPIDPPTEPPLADPPSSQPDPDQGFSLDALYPAVRYYAPVPQEKKWFYRNLSQSQREIYQKIDRSVAGMQSGKIHLGACTYPDLALAYTAVKSDHPEYFWMPSGYIYELRGGQMYVAFDYDEDGYRMSYHYSRAERDFLLQGLREILAEAASVLTPGMSEYQRELALHDWLAARLTYDRDTAGGSKAHPAAFTIACLADGSGVCEGYSRAFQLLLYFAGVENVLVTGQVGKTGHMWNLVKADGAWYHADVTWNDSGDEGLHTYFNLTDAGIAADHTLDPDYNQLTYDDLMDSKSFNLNLPACSSVYANYFAQTGGLILSEETFGQTVANALADAAAQGRRSTELLFADSYPVTFSSSFAMLQRLSKEKCVGLANARLPADKQISVSIACNGVIGSRGFSLSW